MIRDDPTGRPRSIRTDEEIARELHEDWDRLDEEQKHFVLACIDQIRNERASSLLTAGRFLDFEEPPVPVRTFFTSPYFLGEMAGQLYPQSVDDLVDIFENGYHEVIISGAIGIGKAQPLTAKVLTPTGWKRMGDVRVGDRLVNPEGGTTRVLGVFPQGVKPVYRVTFSDGSSTECCDDHLWEVSTPSQRSRQRPGRVLPLREIRKRTHGAGGHRQHFIPMTVPVAHSDVDLPLEPYTLGALLGDGGLTQRSPRLTTADAEVLNAVASGLPAGVVARKVGASPYDYGLTCGHRGGAANPLTETLRNLGLMGLGSAEKFIPEVYLTAPLDARIALLQGLFDTDGSPAGASGDRLNNCVEFCSTSEQLVRDVRSLVQSLGGVARVSGPRRTSCAYKGRRSIGAPSWRLIATLPAGIQPFRLQRKLSVYQPGEKYQPSRSIESVDYIGDAACQCIQVSSERGLYVTDDYIVTHNTTTGVLILLRMLYECLCLRNPQRTYGLLPGAKIHFVILSATAKLAQKVVYESMIDYLRGSPYFQNVGFHPVKDEIRFPKNIRVMGGASSDKNVLGMNAFGGIIDETNFRKKQKNQQLGQQNQPKDSAEAAYTSIVRRMKSRFITAGKVPGILCLLSSKNLQDDFTERRVKEAQNDPKVFYREYALWEVNRDNFSSKTFRVLVGNEMMRSRILTAYECADGPPQGCKIIDVPEDLRVDFERDINGAIRDIAGIATIAKEPFIAMREKIALMVDRSFQHPFGVQSWVYGRPLQPRWDLLFATNEDGFNVPLINPEAPRHAHLDLSKNQCATGLVIGHIAGTKRIRRVENGLNIERDLPVVRFDVVLQILPPDGEEIIINEVVNLIYEFVRQGMPVQSVSMDGFQSLSNIQRLRSDNFIAENWSSEKLGRYEEFKQAIYDGRVITYEYEPLLKELRELEKDYKTGKVVKPENGCFTADTRVRLLDGRALRFDELVREFGDGRTFYLYTIKDGAVSVGAARRPRVTKRNARLVAVTLDSGEVIRCTPCHRFMLRDGSYVRADRLTPGTSLMPLYTKISTRSTPGKLAGYELYYCPSDGAWHFTHRMVGKWRFPDVGYTGNQHGRGVIHHLRGKLNNDPLALEWLESAAAHAAAHAEDLRRRRADPAFERKRLDGLRRYNDDPANRAAQARRLRALWRDPDFLEAHTAAIAATGRRTGPINLTKYNKSDAHRRKASEIGKRTIWVAIEHTARRDVTLDRILKLRRDGCSNKEIALRLQCSLSLVQSRVSQARKNGIDIPASPYLRRNHKVVSVTPLAEREDVYDLTVDGTHNFALDAGVFVHNSKDVADAACCVATWLSERPTARQALEPEKGVVEVVNKSRHSPYGGQDQSGVTSAQGDSMLWGDEDGTMESPDDLDLPFILG